jgi:non-specific serine/threonine protein kinase
VKALAGAGRLAHIQQDSNEARALLNEALGIARELGDRWWAAWTLHLLGRVAYFDGDAEAARSYGRQSLDLAREIQDRWLEGWALHLLALADHIEGRFAEARRLYEESLVVRRPIDFREGIVTVLTLLGLIDFSEGDYHAALAHMREGLQLYWGIDFGWLTGNVIAQFLALAAAVGQPERAARLWGALSALSEAVAMRPIPLVEAFLGPAVAETRRALGEERFDAETLAGRRMSPDEVAAEALALDVAPPPQSHNGHPEPRSSVAHPDGLTAREVEVLRLIASGRTTQEIADELVISVNTVERHITHVYQKIGARGRAEATAYALQHALA